MRKNAESFETVEKKVSFANEKTLVAFLYPKIDNNNKAK